LSGSLPFVWGPSGYTHAYIHTYTHTYIHTYIHKSFLYNAYKFDGVTMCMCTKIKICAKLKATLAIR